MKNLTYLFVFIFTLNVAFAANNLKDNNLETTTTIVKHDVFFDTDKDQITTQEFQKLLHFIKTTENVAIERISILGYCDDTGSSDYNKELSNKRANTIRDIIANYRNSLKKPEVVNTVGKGEITLSTSETALLSELRALNRKVSIIIMPKKLIANSFYGEDLRKGDLINLKSLNFKRGLRYLTLESMKNLKELADYLVQRKGLFFTINGHVCCTKNGKESRDRETGKINLSEVRAKYIRDYLVKAGVDAKRIRYQGLKGQYNLGGDASEDRRVELLVRHISE